jgi:hypothetical protein
MISRTCYAVLGCERRTIAENSTGQAFQQIHASLIIETTTGLKIHQTDEEKTDG